MNDYLTNMPQPRTPLQDELSSKVQVGKGPGLANSNTLLSDPSEWSRNVHMTHITHDPC